MKENNEIKSTAHSKYRCQYHIVFAPKYRRQIIYRQLSADIGKRLRELCERKGVEIIEAEACADHIHMLVSIPPKYSISSFMGYLNWAITPVDSTDTELHTVELESYGLNGIAKEFKS